MDPIEERSGVQVELFTNSSSNMDAGPSLRRRSVDVRPSPKRQRTMSAVSIVSSTSPVLSLMRWVHETMKQDLVEAHSKSVQELVNCCN